MKPSSRVHVLATHLDALAVFGVPHIQPDTASDRKFTKAQLAEYPARWSVGDNLGRGIDASADHSRRLKANPAWSPADKLSSALSEPARQPSPNVTAIEVLRG